MEPITFDIDRLANEIDNLFQEKLKSKQKAFRDNISQILVNREQEFKRIMKRKEEDFKNNLLNTKEELLAEIKKGRTLIVLSDKKQINVEHMDHPAMENVVETLNMTNKAMLVGPAGTGKTYMIAEIAKRMDLPFYKYSCSRDSSVHDLLGYKQPKSETYLETTFLKAYENGGVFLVDEYDAMSGDMALFFNGIADNSDFISVPHRDDKPQAKKHKDFYLVMCGNTWGKGSTDYSGRDFQDMALMDRFRFSRHFIGYHTTLEKQLVPDYEFVINLRKALEDVGSYLSTRNVEDISKLLGLGKSRKQIIHTIGQDLSKEDITTISKHMKGEDTPVGEIEKTGFNLIFDVES